MMKYFDSVKEIIKTYSLENIKELDECVETKEKLKIEKKASNPYIRVAENFLKFENGGKVEKDTDKGDWYFYLYLKSLEKDDEYAFPLEDGSYVIAKVNLFKPYDDLTKLLNPQWHLLVSHYAYIDAGFNHNDDINANKIKEANKWNRKYIIKDFKNRNKVIYIWMKEARTK